MASPSTGTYLVEGLKISLNILQDCASDLPSPASSIINLVQRIVAAIEVCPVISISIVNLIPSSHCRRPRIIEKNAIS